MEQEFIYYVNFGTGDSGEAYLYMDVTEEEFERLKQARASGKEFYECDSVRDIYKRIRELADEEATADLKAAEILNPKYDKASDLYPLWVDYPYDINKWYEEEFEQDDEEEYLKGYVTISF